jgi:LmbE family N-acetylglucosaminyl deacetylase
MRIARLFVRVDPETVTGATPYEAITHRVDVRRYARQKQAALAAHQSQMGVGRGGKVFSVLIRIPARVFGLLLGIEWYVEPGRAGSALQRDIFERG